jgi:hypothetical protein
MVAAIFVHTFLNFFLKVVAEVVSKSAGVPAVEHTVEEFFAKLLNSVLGFFRKL